MRKAHKFFSSKIIFLYFLSYFYLSSLPICSLPSSLSLFLITVLWKIQNLLFTMTDFLLKVLPAFSSVQFSHSVVSDSLWPDELQHAKPPYHQLPESTQTHVHWFGDAIQPSHSLSSPSPPTFNFSQHHGLFKWVISLHQVAKILEFQPLNRSFQWTPRTNLI